MNGTDITMDTRLRDLTVWEFLQLLGRTTRQDILYGLEDIARYLHIGKTTASQRLNQGVYGDAAHKWGLTWRFDTAMFEENQRNTQKPIMI